MWYINVYTGNVFRDNYRYFRWGISNLLTEVTDITLSEERFHGMKFPILALSTKYPKTYWSQNKLSILPMRYKLIEYGFTLNFDKKDKDKEKDADNRDSNKSTVKGVKVWGKGWPTGVSEGDSRGSKDREEEKKKILSTGLFCLAIENTDTPYYVTEKIWESIESLCLPIYWSNSTIYMDFPENSFIDAKKFYYKWGEKHWCGKLYKYIIEMTREEYIDRINKCIRTFNLLCTKGLNNGLKKDADHRDLHLVDYTRNWQDFKTIFKSF